MTCICRTSIAVATTVATVSLMGKADQTPSSPKCGGSM